MSIERNIIGRKSIVRSSIGLVKNFSIILTGIENISEENKYDYALKRNLLYFFKKQGEIKLSRDYPEVNSATERDYSNLVKEYNLHI